MLVSISNAYLDSDSMTTEQQIELEEFENESKSTLFPVCACIGKIISFSVSQWHTHNRIARKVVIIA